MKRYLFPINKQGEVDKSQTLWQKICSMENLELAHKNASRGKRWYKEVQVINKNPEKYLKKVQNMLAFKTYTPLPYFKFEREERGKVRTIYKSHYFPERIIQWAVLQVISPILLRQFVYDTYSAIPERGIHLALKRVQDAIQGDKEGTTYCLKMDVRHFYPSIDREILIEQYEGLFKDEDLLWYLRINIRQSPDTGIPIGNYLSQFSGNFYLSPFDHWIKEVKGVKYYYRYMDDIVILHNSKEYLQTLKEEILSYMTEELHLTIKNNYQIFPIGVRGLDFIGYRVFPDHTLLRSSTCKRMKIKLTYIIKKIESGKPMTYSDWCCVNSYKGWIMHCNGHRLYQKYIKPLESHCERYYTENIEHEKRRSKYNHENYRESKEQHQTGLCVV